MRTSQNDQSESRQQRKRRREGNLFGDFVNDRTVYSFIFNHFIYRTFLLKICRLETGIAILLYL